MIGEITSLEFALFGVALTYVITVIFMRTEKSQRKGARRQGERRLCAQLVVIERRRNSERRTTQRRA